MAWTEELAKEAYEYKLKNGGKAAAQKYKCSVGTLYAQFSAYKLLKKKAVQVSTELIKRKRDAIRSAPMPITYSITSAPAPQSVLLVIPLDKLAQVLAVLA